MTGPKTRTSRLLASALTGALSLSAVACGGQMPFSGNIEVAGDPPPLPPPPPPPPPPKPEPPPRVEVRDNKIEIHEKILFAKDKADILPESFGLVDEIADVFKKNPQIKKVRIKGHTDSDGADAYNLTLSDKRVKSVMKYLVDHGVEEARLEAKGYGETEPLVPNDSDENKAKNRRVEFEILKQDITQKKVEIDAKTGKEKVLEEKKVEQKAPAPSDGGTISKPQR